MARTHKISTTDASVEYDFLTDVLSISDKGWRIQKTRDDKVIETVTLFSGAVDEFVLNAVNTLNKLGYLARLWFLDKLRTNAVWYYLNADDEEGKRALVYDIECVSLPEGLANPLLGNGLAIYQLSITRAFLWEDNQQQLYSDVALSALGGHTHLSPVSGSGGDEDARMEEFMIKGHSSGVASQHITKGWWGIKPERGGTTSFEPLQEIEDAPINSSCSPLPVVTSDSDASGGYCLAWTTSSTLQRLCGGAINAWWDSGSMDVDDYIGKYLVLLRCKVSSAEDVLLQMKYGYSTPGVNLGDKYINNTSYQFIEMGEISIPPGTWRDETSDFGFGRNAASLYIWAKHMSSSVQLRLDCLVLIPTAAHGYANGMSAGYIPSGDDGSVFYHYSDGERYALNYQYGGPVLLGLWSGIQYNGETFRYIREGGVLVFAGERDDAQYLDDVVAINMKIRRLYRNHAAP